jgi:hypothetical protein
MPRFPNNGVLLVNAAMWRSRNVSSRIRYADSATSYTSRARVQRIMPNVGDLCVCNIYNDLVRCLIFVMIYDVDIDVDAVTR